jgi:hypothetical protein
LKTTSGGKNEKLSDIVRRASPGKTERKNGTRRAEHLLTATVFIRFNLVSSLENKNPKLTVL